MDIPLQRHLPNTLRQNKLLLVSISFRRSQCHLPYFKQPSRFLGSHNPQYEIFYIYPASGRLDLPWSMQTVSFLCSLLVDGSTKTKLPGLICKTVAEISDLIPVFQNNFSRVHQSLLFARFICSVNTETQSSIKGSVLQSFGGLFVC